MMLWPEDLILAAFGVCAIAVAGGGLHIGEALAAARHKPAACVQPAPHRLPCTLETFWLCGNRDGE